MPIKVREFCAQASLSEKKKKKSVFTFHTEIYMTTCFMLSYSFTLQLFSYITSPSFIKSIFLSN